MNAKNILKKVGVVMGIISIVAVAWKLFVELPKALKNAKNTGEKISALTILL